MERKADNSEQIYGTIARGQKGEAEPDQDQADYDGADIGIGDGDQRHAARDAEIWGRQQQEGQGPAQREAAGHVLMVGGARDVRA